MHLLFDSQFLIALAVVIVLGGGSYYALFYGEYR